MDYPWQVWIKRARPFFHKNTFDYFFFVSCAKCRAWSLFHLPNFYFSEKVIFDFFKKTVRLCLSAGWPFATGTTVKWKLILAGKKLNQILFSGKWRGQVVEVARRFNFCCFRFFFLQKKKVWTRNRGTASERGAEVAGSSNTTINISKKLTKNKK